MAGAKWTALARIERHPAVDAFVEALPPGTQALSQTLRDLVHANAPDVTEAIYWRTPFFFLHTPLAYLSPTSEHVLLGFVDARRIHDRTGLLRGTGRSSIRRARFVPGETLPKADIARWIRQAAKAQSARRPADP